MMIFDTCEVPIIIVNIIVINAIFSAKINPIYRITI